MRAALPKILLATFGSLGDLHPFIALGRALQREGFAIVLATSSNYRQLVEEQGLGFVAVAPDLDDLMSRLGLDLGGLARRMSEDDGFLFQRIIFPYLRTAYDQLLAESEDVAGIVAHSLAFSAHAVAEKRGLPLVVVTLSPMLLYSAYDPPLGARSPFVAEPKGRLALVYNRALLGLLARLAALWAMPLSQFRRGLSLPVTGPFALFRGAPLGVTTIALHSSLLAPPRPDHSPALLIAGHSFHDSSSQMEEREASALDAFLAQGAAPLVFTLGSFVAHGHEEHYRACMEAAGRLGARAVILAHVEDLALLRASAPADVHVAPYVPHSQLFPRALVVAHHGGIGTSGQALRAGKPQLVTPFLGDQEDNAARLARIGVARVVPGREISPDRLARELRALLDTPLYAQRSKEVGVVVTQEDGAAVAAERIAQIIRNK